MVICPPAKWYSVPHNSRFVYFRFPSDRPPQFTMISTQTISTQPLTLAQALQILEEGDFHERWEVARWFGRLSGKASASEVVAPLIDFLQDHDAEPELRWFVARILGDFQQPEVLTALINILQTSDDYDLKTMAATALMGFGEIAIAALTPLLADPATRALAVNALAQISHSATIQPLLQVVQDEAVEIRAIALSALSNFQDDRIAPVLLKALGDNVASVRRAAVMGLGFRADLLPTFNLVSALQPLLTDPEQEVSCQVAIALGRLGTTQAADALAGALQSPLCPDEVRLEAIRALGWIGTTTALHHLEAFLLQCRHPEALELCREAVLVLGRIEHPELQPQATEILQSLLQNHPLGLMVTGKQAIALSLGHLGQSTAAASLNSLLTDEDASVKFHAMAALNHLHHPV